MNTYGNDRKIGFGAGLQRTAGRGDAASAGKRRRFFGTGIRAPLSQKLRVLLHFPQAPRLRAVALRAQPVRLPGRNAGLHRSGTGLRHRRRQNPVRIQGMVSDVPSRSAARNIARPAHGRLLVLFLFVERSAAHVRTRAADHHQLLPRNPGRVAARHRQALETDHRGQYRGAAQPLRPFLRPTVRYARKRE